MTIASAVALLQTALLLLTLAQSNPQIPQATRDNAISVAQQAITVANSVLSQQHPSSSLPAKAAISATIDQSSLNPAVGAFAISGTAQNTNSVVVALVHSDYSGGTDYDSVSSYVAQHQGTSILAPELVQNNRWTTQSGTLNSALVATIFIYDLNSHALLATGTLRVQGSASPSCNIVATPGSPSFGQTVTLTWNSSNAVGAAWQPDTSGRDNVSVPATSPGTSGSAFVTANVIGNPTVTLRVYGATGATNTCTATFRVLDAYPQISGTAGSYATIDANALTTPARSPSLSGNSNMNGIAVQIYDSNNVVVSGSGFVPVVNGRWSLTIPQTLAPGAYRVELLGPPNTVKATLTITS